MYYASILLVHIKAYFIVYRPDKWVVGLMLIWEKDVHKMHLLIFPSRRQKYLVHCIYMHIPSHSMWVLHGCKVHTIWSTIHISYAWWVQRYHYLNWWGRSFSISYNFFFLIFFFLLMGSVIKIDLLLFFPIWSYLGYLFILYKEISSYFHYPLCINNILTSSVFTLLLQKVYSQSEKWL